GNWTTYTYDNANRLTKVDTGSDVTTYTYDDNGNRRTIEGPNGELTTNTWDFENRLVQVEHDDGMSAETTEYLYNADGLLIEKRTSSETTRFVYDGNNRLMETDDVGMAEVEFTYEPLPYANVLSQRRDGDSSFYHFDPIGNVRELTDDT